MDVPILVWVLLGFLAGVTFLFLLFMFLVVRPLNTWVEALKGINP